MSFDKQNKKKLELEEEEVFLLKDIFEEQAIYEYIDRVNPDCPYRALWDKVIDYKRDEI